MFIATALSPRGEDSILSSSPRGSGASDYKSASGHFAGSTAAPQQKTKTTDNKKIKRKQRNVQSVVRSDFGAEFVLEPPLGHHPMRYPAREQCERGAWRQSERGTRPYCPAGTDYRFSAGLPEHHATPRAGDRRQVPGGGQGGHQ